MTDSSFSAPIYPHSVFGIFLVMILIAIVVVKMMPKSTERMPQVQDLVVVKNSVVNIEDDPKTDLKESKTDMKSEFKADGARDGFGIVRAKTVLLQQWSNEDSTIAEPFMNSNDESSFGEFQKTLMFGREIRDSETPEKEGFSESNVDRAAPPAILTWSSDVTEQEARSLARDAFQQVPQTYSPDFAEDTLRGISDALLECAKVGVHLPEMPEEQRENLLFWSNTKTKAAEIAKQILNRM